MHVAHVIDELPPDGAERLLADLMSCRTSAIRYSVLCIDREGELATEIRAAGVSVHLIGRRGRFDAGVVARLARWFRAHDVSAVHTHLSTADNLGRLAATLSGVPVIVSTIHSTNVWKGRVQRFADRLLARSGAVIACSEEVARCLRERDRIPASRIYTVSNGVNVARVSRGSRERLRRQWGVREDEILIGVVGRLHEAKGQGVFLEALASLCRDVPNVRGVLVGSGALESELNAVRGRLGLDSRVVMAGQRSDMPDVFAALDILAMPSVWEGLPMTLLEGMACALPVVASRVGGIPDVIEPGRNGLLCASGNATSLAACLRELAGAPARRAALGAAARDTVLERYDISKTLRAYEALYETRERKNA